MDLSTALVTLRDSSGAGVALGSEIGRGGEGAVFDVVGQPEKVAKIYLAQPSQNLADKIRTMADGCSPGLLKLAAWPTSTLYGDKGNFVGFLMPKVSGSRPVFQLYGPKLRLQQFPRADWRFLLHAAANTARAFTDIHASGHVIGDVNHGNMVVAQDATVRFIDCDSFQISDGKRIWYCEVGVGTHQPPEMQGLSSYKGITRTPNHDAFGLAIIIFQLLCMARHPFSGRFLGTGEPPGIEEAIQHCRYAFSKDTQRTKMAPPPASLPIEALTPTIQSMFELAFSPSTTGGGRPTAAHWVSALAEMSSNLRQCWSNPSHHHLSSFGRCPWCEIETKTGTILFPVVFIPGTGADDGIVLLWKEITSVPDPGPPPPMPDLTVMRTDPSPLALAVRKKQRRIRVTASAVFLLGLVLVCTGLPLVPLVVCVPSLYVIWRPPAKGIKRIRQAYESAKRDWQMLADDWNQSPRVASFTSTMSALVTLKREYDDLPNEHARRAAKLRDGRRLSQMAEHLDKLQLADARIPGIGKAKIATLQSYQIFTASDVDPLQLVNLKIPGFGPKNRDKILSWRQECERSFRYDPNRGVSPAETSALQADITRRRSEIVRHLRNGLGQLRTIAADTTARRNHLKSRASEILPAIVQGRADAAAVGIAP